MRLARRMQITLAMTAAIASPAWAAEACSDKASPPGPVRLKVAQSIAPLAACRLASPAGPIDAQADADGNLWAWGRVVMQDGSPTFLPGSSPEDDPDAGVKAIQVREGLIEVRIDGKLFTALNWGDREPKPFLWPVIGPTDAPVTRAYPMKDLPDERKDHVHHRSIWSAWGDVRTQDLTRPGSNYWAVAKEPRDQDRQIVRKIVRTGGGPVFGQIVADIDWTNRTGRREFAERRTYTFYRGDERTRVIDVRNAFAFDDGDVTFADTKEAGILSIRIATSMDEIALDRKPGRGVITNSAGGRGAGQCWGRPAQWCDYTGPVGGQLVGIAVFDRPGNPGHPPRWHVRDYGLYTVNPFSVRDFPDGKGKDGSHLFKKDERPRFDYRIVIHRGDAEAAGVARLYKLYADDPAAAPKKP